MDIRPLAQEQALQMLRQRHQPVLEVGLRVRLAGSLGCAQGRVIAMMLLFRARNNNMSAIAFACPIPRPPVISATRFESFIWVPTLLETVP